MQMKREQEEEEAEEDGHGVSDNVVSHQWCMTTQWSPPHSQHGWTDQVRDSVHIGDAER